jgi:hypothetical protein
MACAVTVAVLVPVPVPAAPTTSKIVVQPFPEEND